MNKEYQDEMSFRFFRNNLYDDIKFHLDFDFCDYLSNKRIEKEIEIKKILNKENPELKTIEIDEGLIDYKISV